MVFLPEGRELEFFSLSLNGDSGFLLLPLSHQGSPPLAVLPFPRVLRQISCFFFPYEFPPLLLRAASSTDDGLFLLTSFQGKYSVPRRGQEFSFLFQSHGRMFHRLGFLSTSGGGLFFLARESIIPSPLEGDFSFLYSKCPPPPLPDARRASPLCRLH